MFKMIDNPSAEAPSVLEGGVGLDELGRRAAQEMLAVTLETERRAHLDARADVVDRAGRQAVVGNGLLPVREVTAGAGMVQVKAP